MFDSQTNAQLQEHFKLLRSQVLLEYQLDESRASADLESMFLDLSSLSHKIKLQKIQIANVNLPAFRLSGEAVPHFVTFSGVPGGEIFNLLILAILYAGGHPPRLAEQDIKHLRDIRGHHRFLSFVQQGCPFSTDTIRLFNLLALYNPNIEHHCAEIACNQDLVEQYRVVVVPMVFHNSKIFAEGFLTFNDLRERLLALEESGKVPKQKAAQSKQEVIPALIAWKDHLSQGLSQPPTVDEGMIMLDDLDWGKAFNQLLQLPQKVQQVLRQAQAADVVDASLIKDLDFYPYISRHRDNMRLIELSTHFDYLDHVIKQVVEKRRNGQFVQVITLMRDEFVPLWQRLLKDSIECLQTQET